MPIWQTVVHVLLQIFIVGTGMSIGREVAPRELGAMFGQRFARWVRLDAKDTRMLVAITAADDVGGPPPPRPPVWPASITRRSPARSSRWRFCLPT